MTHTLHLGDCRAVLASLDDNSVDSIVCDPPYELGFMGKAWDNSGIAYDVTVWQQCLRVLKPGGHLVAFGGSRTYHRLAVAIEDAGFEIRDQIQWIYGCLDEQTQIVTPHGLRQYHKLKIGDTVLCYNIDNKSYQYEQIQDVVVYDYHDTAYRISGDFGEQIVSRNHRVIVERNGAEVFIPAEALQSEERIPILENMHTLRQAISNAQSHTAITQQSVLKRMPKSSTTNNAHGQSESQFCQSCSALLSMRDFVDDVSITNQESASNHLQSSVQWETASERIDSSFAQGHSFMDRGNKISTETANDWQSKPIMEGRSNIPQSQGVVCKSINQVCAVSDGVCNHGTQGWICDGTSDCGSNSDQSSVDTNGSGASHQSRCNQQSYQQFNVICDQCRAQIIRAQQGHKTTMVRIVPFTYTGKVWCVRVPSGAFVAERNGVYFPTGNSGFPKSLDVSKAMDKQAGATREKRWKPITPHRMTGAMEHRPWIDKAQRDGELFVDGETPATDLAKQWQGWGTALKPAHEPAVLARKPLCGTVADNVMTWGVGALNIDACRVGFEQTTTTIKDFSQAHGNQFGKAGIAYPKTGEKLNPPGRWPANVILDEDAAEALDAQSGVTKSTPQILRQQATNGLSKGREAARVHETNYSDSGGASRFFYIAKASRAEREAGLDAPDGQRANHHPTVKPLALMRHLVRLVTPKGGKVLDPFMGSGSTGCAAVLEGMGFVGIDITPEYVAIAQKRIDHYAVTSPLEGA